MKWRDSVGVCDMWNLEIASDWTVVFRSAHGSSNAMREWMGETKKKR